MCGITGIIKKTNSNISFDLEQVTNKLLDFMKYRGPDNQSSYFNENFSFGHLRLSIIDLSNNSNQPMWSADGNYLITYNGEIYNYLELKEELINKYEFNTNSDTEVILNSYAEWGYKCLKRFNGMWSFVIYDKRKNEFFGSRDRMGIKPFYYLNDNEKFVFSSEIKCFQGIPEFKYEINLQNLMDNMIFGPKSYGSTQINSVYELEAGSYFILKNNNLEINKYFHLETTFENQSNKYDLNEIEYFLDSSIKFRLRSDVPVATLNSGGLDSSLLSALAVKYKNDLNTYSVSPCLINGIEQQGDESKFANLLSEHIKSKHKTIRYDLNGFIKLLNFIIYLNDGEVYHSNSIPLYILFKEIKNDGITVVLGGEGADEIFLGYSSNLILNISRFLPKFLFNYLFNKKLKSKNYLFEYFINYKNAISMINTLYIRKQVIEILYNNKFETPKERKELFYIMNNMSPENALTYFEQKCYLSGLLKRLDRVSMGNSIESRVPFLDFRIVEYMNKIKFKNKVSISKKGEKILLKEIAKKYLPTEIIKRPKYGFATPVNKYLKIFNNNELLLENEKWYFFSTPIINNNVT